MSLASACNLAVCLLFALICLALFAVPFEHLETREVWQQRAIYGVLGCAAVQVFIYWREGHYSESKAMPRTSGFEIVTRKDETR